MAGRGTDILLEPGLDDRIAGQWALLPERDRPDFPSGLRVIGTETNYSPRIDLQLSGRSGRQGNFGVAQGLLSLEDRLLNLYADGILKLVQCRKTDSAGRTYFAGPAVDAHVRSVQRVFEREAEEQRSLLNDYTAVIDRQTDLFYRHRREAMGSPAFKGRSLELARSLAGRLGADYFAEVTPEGYPARFVRFADELRLDYQVDCSALWGCDLTLLPAQLGRLFLDRLDELERGVGPSNFNRLAILLYLNTCDEQWKGHLSDLQGSILNQTLSNRSHKSAVAAYVRESFRAWGEFLERVETEYLSQLLTFPVDRFHPRVSAPVRVHEDARALMAAAKE
jgi:preprotein translocase subunit SecA